MKPLCKMFLGPMMDELDQLVQKNLEELDKIEELVVLFNTKNA